MEEKKSDEVRRRKILDNAEARLRFIKEGVPWRRTEENEVVRDTERVESKEEKISKEECSAPSEDCGSSLDPTDPAEASLQNSDSLDARLAEIEAKLNSLSNLAVKSDTLLGPNTFINREASFSGLKSIIGENENVFRDLSMISVRSESGTNLPSRPDDAANQSENTLRTLKALLSNSKNERQQQKLKADQYNKNMWTSCFLMFFLGVFARVAYNLQLSWLFNEVMLVPFVTGAIPLMLSLLKDPPAPSGAIVQVLLMAGVKTTVLRRAFTVVTVLRTFLQLFSVYLISFVLSHQIVLSY